MKKLYLYIFHYHLLPGGVTDVIMGWLRLIAVAPEQVFPGREVVVTLVCGRSNNVAELRAEFQAQQNQQKYSGKLSCRFIVDEDLAYFPQQGQCHGLAKGLASRLLQRYGAQETEEVLWWVHNYHLGKNVVFTKALLSIIAAVEGRQAAFNVLLQIHDFPECGRFVNYGNLVEGLGSCDCLYPIAAHVCYATINKRDFAVLRDAGLPEGRLFFLPNPLRFNSLEVARGSELRGAFAKSFGKGLQGVKRFPRARYAAEKPIALYPVRCIRRKNVLELGVLNLLAGEPWNIVCTLPGRSVREKPYSDLVSRLFQQGFIQGRCGVGLELDELGWSFDMLCAASDLVVCSSVMEGFGFTYFNPMYWNKVLVARQLDVLEGFGHCFPDAIFYRELKVPLEAGDAGSEALYRDLRRKYFRYAAGLPGMAAANLALELEQRLPEQMPAYIDFAFLSVPQQVALLRVLYCALYDSLHDATGGPSLHDFWHDSSKAFLQACRECNQGLLADLEGLSNDFQAPQGQAQGREVVAAEFAEQRLRGILHEVVACFEQGFHAKGVAEAGSRSAERVLRSFSKLEYNYAILWDDDYSALVGV